MAAKRLVAFPAPEALLAVGPRAAGLGPIAGAEAPLVVLEHRGDLVGAGDRAGIADRPPRAGHLDHRGPRSRHLRARVAKDATERASSGKTDRRNRRAYGVCSDDVNLLVALHVAELVG